MDQQYLNEESEAGTESTGVEQALEHFKSTLHEMKLQDAIHRQTIRKLERDNDNMEQKMSELKQNIDQVEKQKKTDEQYLMKQQEVIVNLEMSEEIKGEKPTESEQYKDRVKFKKASLNRTKDLQSAMRETAFKSQTVSDEISELRENSARIEEIPEENRPSLVKDLLVKMIDVLENMNVSKNNATKTSMNSASHSKTFTKKNKNL